MIQILFEGLVRTMREYVSEKRKYFQMLKDIEQRWEYSDKKKVNAEISLKQNLIY